MDCFKQQAKNISLFMAALLCVGLFSACAIPVEVFRSNNEPKVKADASKSAETHVATTQVAENSTNPAPVDCNKSALERSLEKEPASDRGVTGFFKNLFVETAAVAVDVVSPIPVASTAHEAHGIYQTGKVAERAYSDKDCNNSTTAKP